MGPKHYVIGTETNGKYDKPGKVSEKSEKMLLSEIIYSKIIADLCGDSLIGIYWIISDNIGNQKLNNKSSFKNGFDNAYLIPWGRGRAQYWSNYKIKISLETK